MTQMSADERSRSAFICAHLRHLRVILRSFALSRSRSACWQPRVKKRFVDRLAVVERQAKRPAGAVVGDLQRAAGAEDRPLPERAAVPRVVLDILADGAALERQQGVRGILRRTGGLWRERPARVEGGGI